MLVEIDGDELYFQTISNERGQAVDSGVVRKATTDNRVIGTSGKPGPGAQTGPAKPAPAAPKPSPPQPQRDGPVHNEADPAGPPFGVLGRLVR